MDTDLRRVQELLERLAESLNVEVKSWISLDDPQGTAKIVRGIFALRNRNGGYLVIGFNNNALQAEITGRPADVRGIFHIDKVQGLVSRYASEIFEVAVAFPQFDGKEYPVICVPVGVQAPVAAKSDLLDAGKKLISVGDVYFRTLNANGTPSTAVARPQDWRDIVNICFDNREGEIGAFLRRQLAGRDIANLATALTTISPGTAKASSDESRSKIAATLAKSETSLRDKTLAFLNDGCRRFNKAISDRKVTPEEKSIVAAGSWKVALLIEPPCNDTLPDQAFY